jgi:uncharacterized protein YijF (DUF1287 family)
MTLSDEARKAKVVYQREYRKHHRDQFNAYSKKWRIKNKDKINQYNEKYWEKKSSTIQRE